MTKINDFLILNINSSHDILSYSSLLFFRNDGVPKFKFFFLSVTINYCCTSYYYHLIGYVPLALSKLFKLCHTCVTEIVQHMKVIWNLYLLQIPPKNTDG